MFYKSLFLTVTSSLLTAAFALVSINGAAAEEKKSYIGATLGLPGGGTLIGVSGTYDFKLPQSEITPYAGIGVAGASLSGNGFTYSGGSGVYIEAGADYNISDSFVANANYKFNSLGYFSIGAGYRF
jgi:outer membrane protein W